MPLKKRVLGKSTIEVTEIGLGLWAAGGGDWGAADSSADADPARQLADAAGPTVRHAPTYDYSVRMCWDPPNRSWVRMIMACSHRPALSQRAGLS